MGQRHKMRLPQPVIFHLDQHIGTVGLRVKGYLGGWFDPDTLD